MNKQTLLFYKIFSIFSYLNAEKKKKKIKFWTVFFRVVMFHLSHY